MSDDSNDIHGKAVDLLKRLKNNWDYIGSSNQALTASVGLITKDCAELSRNSRYRNVLLGLLANHGQPPSLEEVLMDHFKTLPTGMTILDSEENLSAVFSAHLVSSKRNGSTRHVSKDRKRTNHTAFMQNIISNPSFLSIRDQFLNLKSRVITPTFMIGLFKEELNAPDMDSITFLEVQRRLDCIDRHMRLTQETFSVKLASKWEINQVDESKKLHFSREDLLMEADAAWVPEFSKLFSSGYVDEMAGLCVIGGPSGGPESQDVEDRPQAEGQEMKDREGKGMGSVFEIRNPLSPQAYAWLKMVTKKEKYFEDTDHQQGRLRRVASLMEKITADDEDGFVVFGNPPNSYGYLTMPVSAADLFIMQIGQYIRKKHSDFITDYIAGKHGQETLRSVFPQALPPIDTIIAQAANQGNNSTDLGKHSDLKPGLHKNGNGPGGPFDLTTPTLSIQNHNIGCTYVRWLTPADGPDPGSQLRKGWTCSRSHISYQGFGVQVRSEHETSTDSSEISGTGTDFVRQVYSCRSIAPYFNTIFDQLEEGGQKKGIEVVGGPETYTRTLDSLSNLSLNEDKETTAPPIAELEDLKDKDGNYSPQHGDGNGETATSTGSIKKKKRSTETPSGQMAKRPKLFSHLLINLKKVDFRTLWKWKVRKEDAIYALPSGLKLAALAETCFQWCASSTVHRRMVEKKVLFRTMSIPLGVSKKRNAAIPGPTTSRVQRDFFEWDYGRGCLLKLGTQCVTSVIAQKYGIKANTSNWSTWPVETDLLNGAMFREMEKNQLSMPLDLRSFTADLEHILKGEKREGAWAAGSGGGMNNTGQQPPAGVGHHFLGIFEKAQEVSDSKNLAIIRQSGKRTLINVFVTENMHPHTFGESPIMKNPSKEKCYYLGVYELGDVRITTDTEEELDKVVQEYKKKNLPGINGFLLRFREKPHIRIQFNPVEMPEIEDLSKWTMLEVAVDDPRRLLYVLPASDVTKMLDPTNDDAVRLGAVYDNLVGQEEVIDGLKKPVFGSDKQEENNSLLLTSQTKRMYRLPQFMEILYKMAMGVFLRLLEVNVDENGRIGPLVPPCNTEDNSLPEYIRLFGHDPRFANFLGLEIQRSPSPHPMRSYDANRLWLIQEFGPGIQRDKRKGPGFLETNREEATRMLISIFVTETVGNPCILQDWSYRLQDNALIFEDEEDEYQSQSDEEEHEQELENRSDSENRERTEEEKEERNKKHSSQLEDADEEENMKSCKIPGNLEEVESFIVFVDAALKKKGQESFSVLLNGYYKLPKLFRSSIAFNNTLRHWTHTGASELLNYAIEIENECRSGKCEKTKKWPMIKKKMIEILSFTGSLGKSSSTLEFFVWHIMADMDELISDHPFGRPESVSSNFGSELGMKRLERKSKKGGILKLSKEILKLWLLKSDDELSMMGLYRNETGGMNVRINNREVTVLDVEHWLCKLYWFSERDTGGSRSFSTRPSTHEAHLHPCMDIVWGPELHHICQEAVDAMKRMIKDKA